MNRRKKLKKGRILILILIIILIISIPTFGRYTYNNLKEMYLASKKFYFNSSFLETNKSYTNWSGRGTYVITFEVYTYDNKLRKMEEDITCLIEANIVRGNATCYITCGQDTSTKGNTSSSLEKAIEVSKDNKIIVNVYVVPTANIAYDDNILIDISATSLYPYTKELSNRVTLTSTDQSEYRIVDTYGENYAELILSNEKNKDIVVNLTFDPSKIEIDSFNSIFSDSNTSYTTTKIDSIDYISQIQFTMSSESAKSIKFYKRDRNKNYTYEQNNSETSESIINVKF